jgi:hypothetical protein
MSVVSCKSACEEKTSWEKSADKHSVLAAVTEEGTERGKLKNLLC